MFRKKMSKKASKRLFRATAASPLKVNTKPYSSRGGIRL